MIGVRRTREPARGATRRGAGTQDGCRQCALEQNARLARLARKEKGRSGGSFPGAGETTWATEALRLRLPLPHWRRVHAWGIRLPRTAAPAAFHIERPRIMPANPDAATARNRRAPLACPGSAFQADLVRASASLQPARAGIRQPVPAAATRSYRDILLVAHTMSLTAFCCGCLGPAASPNDPCYA